MRGRGWNVAIIVDNPKRDLRGHALLAHELTKLGARVYLVPMYEQGYDLPLLGPDLVILNYARESNRPLLTTYRQLGFRVAVLDTEGGVLSEDGLDSPVNWAKAMHASGMAGLVDDYCFWGDAVKKAFVRHSGLDEKAMRVTGCPRYDLCSVPWSALLSYKRKGFVLVNTNFSALNPRFTRSADDETKIFKSLGWDSEYIEKLFRELKGVFPKFLDEIEFVARSLPDRVIQVRPHPFEDPRPYRARFDGLENVVVDGEGDILNAIHAADCVVHLNCGSAIDSVRLGKTPISIEYLNTELMRRHAPLPSRLSYCAEDRKMLLSLIRNPKSVSDKNGENPEVERWYYLNDGMSARRVATFLISRLGDQHRRARRSIAAALRGSRRHATWKQLLLGGLGALIGTRAASILAVILRRGGREKGVRLQSVAKLMEQYAELEQRAPAISTHARNTVTGTRLASIEIELR